MNSTEVTTGRYYIVKVGAWFVDQAWLKLSNDEQSFSITNRAENAKRFLSVSDAREVAYLIGLGATVHQVVLTTDLRPDTTPAAEPLVGQEVV